MSVSAEVAILDPDLPIVDPHHHLWHRDGQRYLANELRADLDSGHKVEGTVYVECLSHYLENGPAELRPVGETGFVRAELAEPLRTGSGEIRAGSGIVAFADLSLGDGVAAVLDAHEQAGEGRFRGIRYASAWHEGDAIRSHYATRPSMLTDPAVHHGIRQLGARGFTYDVWCYFTQLADVVVALDACPDTIFVLDHCGGIVGIGPWHDRREEAMAIWRPLLARIAARPNVVVKLGGLGMPLAGFAFHQRAVPPSHGDLAAAWAPYIEHAIDCFGPDRCMFESNWPVDATAGSYAIVWNAFKHLSASASANEREALFAGTARRIYRLG